MTLLPLIMLPSPRLPVELCEFVIDNLDIVHDKATLLACSLTCKTFLHASRYHLFHHVQIPDARRAKRFLVIIRSSTHLSTHLCAYVRQLTMVEGRSRNQYEPRWLKKALPILTTCLLKVTVLRLDYLCWKHLNAAARTAITSGFKKVKHLTILELKLETPQQLNQLIVSFPSLTHLECFHLYWKTDQRPVMPYTPLPRSLTNITMCGVQPSFFYELISLDPDHGVRALNLPYMNGAFADVGRILKTLGSRLERVDFRHLGYGHGLIHHRNPECAHLFFFQSSLMEKIILSIPFFGGFFFLKTDVFTHDINLAHNTHLRSISLDCGFVNRGLNDPMDWVFTAFSRIISPHLEHVLLQLHIEDVANLDVVDWARIDHITKQQPWAAHLQRLTIHLSGPLAIRSEACRSVGSRLPLLNGCGILSVEMGRNYHMFYNRMPD